jgi:pimeloyl-ACP methyl ester carboxylesterase
VLLEVKGHGDAVVSLPRGALGKRPVVIATHGNYDRPEWQCMVWREIVGDSAFILCPRGVSRPDSPSREDIRFTYSSNQALEQELDAALAALRERFAGYVDDSAPLYTGFSLGAIMGVSIAARAPSRYRRLVLIEGGHDKWTPEAAKAFAAGGGERVLFVCSQAYCANDARRASARLDKAGVATKVVRGPDVGHRYDGPTAAETKKALPWVLE